MIKRIVPEWMVPRGGTYRKPKDWADNLKPDPEAAPAHPEGPPSHDFR